MGEPVRQSKHPEDFQEIAQGNVAVAVFEILIGRPGKTGPSIETLRTPTAENSRKSDSPVKVERRRSRAIP